MEAFDQVRAGVKADRSHFFKDLTDPFVASAGPALNCRDMPGE